MGLKRKRSSEDTSSPSAFSMSSHATSSPSPSPWQSIPPRPDVDAQMELTFPISKPFRPHDDAGRTRKRWRNRPNEHSIHEHTIQKLFNAQKEHPHAEPILSNAHLPTIRQPSAPQKSTLHEFWNIRRPQPIFTVPTLPEEALGLRCEDCDRSLTLTDDMDSMMCDPHDVFACGACGRNVCDFCTVQLDGRRCLECVQEGRA